MFDRATAQALGKGAFVYMDAADATIMHVALSPSATIPLAGRLGIQQASPPVLVDSQLNTPVLNSNVPGGLLARPFRFSFRFPNPLTVFWLSLMHGPSSHRTIL